MAKVKVYFPESKEVTIIKPLTGDETMGEMKVTIETYGNAGQSVIYNTAAINVSPRLYLCTIFVDTNKGAIRVVDTVSGRLYIGPYIEAETVKEVLEKAVDAYASLTVEAKTNDGVEVTGQTVYVYEGADDTGKLHTTAEYDGKPVTFLVSKGFQYFVKISDTFAGHFNPTTAHGFANDVTTVTLTYEDVSSISTFAGLQAAVRTMTSIETAKNALVGKVINDVWVDLDATGNGDAEPKADAQNHPRWLDPMVCTDIQEVEDADGGKHLGAVMMRLYGSRYDIVFDAANREEATESVAQAGVYYYGHAPEYSNEKTYLKDAIVRYNGEFYQSTVAITAPEAFDSSKWSKKTATTYTANGFELLDLEEGAAIPYEKYAQVFKNAYRDTSKNILLYGHNRYETSAYRQYLNSDADKGLYWHQAHIGQVRPSSYNYHGYMAGCSADLLAAAKPVKRVVMANTVCDGGATYEVCDKFFLPTVRDFFGTDNADETYQQFEYWRQVIGDNTVVPNNNNAVINPFRQIRKLNAKTGSAVDLRLRSANRGYSYIVWFVFTGGTLNGYGIAHNAYASVPACVIY